MKYLRSYSLQLDKARRDAYPGKKNHSHGDTLSLVNKNKTKQNKNTKYATINLIPIKPTSKTLSVLHFFVHISSHAFPSLFFSFHKLFWAYYISKTPLPTHIWLVWGHPHTLTQHSVFHNHFLASYLLQHTLETHS